LAQSGSLRDQQNEQELCDAPAIHGGFSFHAVGKKCIPHVSGGFDFIYMLHLVSAMPNAGPHIEFKGYTAMPLECKTFILRLEDEKIKVPTGPGIGVDIDPDYIKKHAVVNDV